MTHWINGNYNQAFRKACAERGVDPVKGSTAYQAANAQAAARKATHNRRMAAATARHEERIVNGTDDIDGVGRDGYEARLTPTWWQNVEMWKGVSVTEAVSRYVEQKVFAILLSRCLALLVFNVRADVAALFIVHTTLDWTPAEVAQLGFGSLPFNNAVPLRVKRKGRHEKPIWVQVMRHGQRVYERTTEI